MTVYPNVESALESEINSNFLYESVETHTVMQQGKPPETQRFCPECGGVLFFDPSARSYGCKACGLSVTRDQLSDLKDRLRIEIDPERKKRRERTEYLDWWLSKK